MAEPATKQPHSFRIVKYSPTLDTNDRKVTDNPSPQSMSNWLDQAEQGDISALTEMQQEMEAKSAHIQGVASTRRAALTALDWELTPDDAAEKGQALITANYCQEQLAKIRTWETTLEFLAEAIGPNVGVVELVWHRGQLVKTVDVPGGRLTRDAMTRTGAIAVMTDDNSLGVSTLSVPYKFAVYHPQGHAQNSLRKTLTHATVWPYLVSHFSRTDWMAFQELYGTPMRVAKYNEGATPATKTVVEDMLRNMGPDVAGHFPEDVVIELLQAAGTGETFEKSLAWAEQKVAILWLGQTLTTDIGNVGSRAAAEVHERVRSDILFRDIKAEARFIRSNILTPMVRLRFPGQAKPVPHFTRVLKEETDVEGSRLRMDQARMMLDAKAPMLVDEFYEATGFTKPVSWPKDALTIGDMPAPATEGVE